jgi:HAE1 family hydrophobic/amphiphilic exporter-1
VALALWLAAAATLSAQEPAPLSLSLQEATRRALERNTSLAVERENLAQAGFSILGAKGSYDALLEAEAGWRKHTDPVNSAFSGAPPGSLAPENESATASTSLSQLLPTGGSVQIFADWGRATSDGSFTVLSPAYSTNLGVSARQPLLRNLAVDPAREAIRVASAERNASAARLTRAVSDTIGQVDAAYWSLVAARRNVASIQSAVDLAERQLSETKIRVEAGALSKTDIAQPTAERERRRGDLALARQRVEEAENTLKILVLGDPGDPAWRTQIVPSDDPESATEPAKLAGALDTALAKRPEILEARWRRERVEVQVIARKSDLLPRLDVVAAYGRRGLAGRANPNAVGLNGQPVVVPGPLEGGWGRSYGTIRDNEFPDASVGLSFSLPLGNRTAKANLAIAKSALSQAGTLVSAAEQQVQAEVRNAVFALESARQRIEAARAARVAAETQLYAEQERFQVGLSTNFLVLTRQNDLTNARVTETSALTDYRKAETELARATGVLLEQRHIAIENPDGEAPHPGPLPPGEGEEKDIR